MSNSEAEKGRRKKTNGGNGHGEHEEVSLGVGVVSVVLLKTEGEASSGRFRVLREDAHQSSRVVCSVLDELAHMHGCTTGECQRRRRVVIARLRSDGGEVVRGGGSGG